MGGETKDKASLSCHADPSIRTLLDLVRPHHRTLCLSLSLSVHREVEVLVDTSLAVQHSAHRAPPPRQRILSRPLYPSPSFLFWFGASCLYVSQPAPSARLLSRELSTCLPGRGTSLFFLPFSFFSTILS
ncbi:hypothetical protein LX32DRAFT_72864 [Colletotrichum zoysiae]|uniref:Uncharacterized protein n=1 Tax=Colletotrichum zoysiae TaxID=1216348 RepID=A0AAD9H9T7_9PEZI|nr:hypothetical protein LX32DRAFT_72864 [Colletotrichum zoysiae]